MCAKFGSDRFRSVDLYKFHTNKQTFIFIHKISGAIRQASAVSINKLQDTFHKPLSHINTILFRMQCDVTALLSE